MSQIPVVLVDSREVMRRGLAACLAIAGGFQVVGEASGPAEGLSLMLQERPRVAILGLAPGDGDSLALCQAMRDRKLATAVVVMAAAAIREPPVAWLKLGVRGWLAEDISAAELAQSVVRVAEGGAVLDAHTTRRVLEWLGGGGLALAALEEPDRSILRLVAEGLTNREIGQRVFLAENTVRARVNDMVRRLHAKNRVEAVMIAERQALW